MKKNIIPKLIIGISLLLMTVVACNKDSLDLKPLDALTEDNVFNDLTLLTGYVNASYSGLEDINDQGQRMGSDVLADLIAIKYNRGDGVPEYAENRVDVFNGESVTIFLFIRNGVSEETITKC